MQKEAICSTASLQIGSNEAKIRKSTCLRNLPQVCYRAVSRLRNLPQVCYRAVSRLRNLPQVCYRAVSRLRNLPQVYYRAESHLRNLPQIIPELNHVCGRFRKHVDFLILTNSEYIYQFTN